MHDAHVTSTFSFKRAVVTAAVVVDAAVVVATYSAQKSVRWTLMSIERQ